ncbi:MAG: hypothetical protein ACKVS9_05485 [Phycisphaerae bacterium]
MNKSWPGIIVAIAAVVLVAWLIGGSKISCRESFWDRDKHVIEIKTP